MRDSTNWPQKSELGRRPNTAKPAKVKGLSDAMAISAVGAHTCALKTTGGVVCWGSNDYGQLGDGTTGHANDKHTPTAVKGLGSGSGVVAGTTSVGHTCALKGDGTMLCWGFGTSYQLGNKMTLSASTPQVVTANGAQPPTLSNIVAIAVGNAFTCARQPDGKDGPIVHCWGDGSKGQLGYGKTPTNPQSNVWKVKGL